MLAKWFLPLYTRKVISQDVWIMEVHGRNMKVFKTPDYKSTQVDFMHIYIESLRQSAETEDVEKAKPQPIKKQIEFWI